MISIKQPVSERVGMRSFSSIVARYVAVGSAKIAFIYPKQAYRISAWIACKKKQRGDNKAMSGKNLESFMDTPLLGPITKGFTDRSTPKVFAFSFYCDTCEKEWRSTPQAFDPGELRSPTDFRIFRMLWNEHRKTAYEQANLEAIYVFHYCPKCGRRMCMECFQRSETDIADICKGCLTNLDISRPFHGMKGKGSGPPFRLMPMHMRKNQDVSNGVDSLRRLTP